MVPCAFQIVHLSEFSGELLNVILTEIAQTDRTRADYPYLPWYSRLLPAAYATYPVNEFRPARMSWLWLEPQAAADAHR